MSAERHAVSTIKRHPLDVRIAHWVAAISFILLGLSGFALFFPGFFFMTALFGGGETARFLHPWLGLALVLSYLVLFVRFVGSCLWKREDTIWILRPSDVLSGREENLPEFGKFIAGQKLYFWGMALLFAVLLVSGVIIWQAYFGSLTSIALQRIAALTHSIFAVLAVLGFVIHVHMVTWEPGTLRAMISGTVTGGWAWKHHRKWLREVVAGKN